MIPPKLHQFYFWCQKVVPLVYDNGLTLYEIVCKVVDYLNNVIKGQNDIIDQLQINSDDIAELKKEVEFLESEIEKVKNGDYVSLYLDSIINWIDKNLQCLVARIVKFVGFGLSEDGHFIACIPESWEFLQFDTGYNYEDKETYGHLILKW